MKERPILFSAPMVRAILAGTKSQTRRVVKLPKVPNRLGQWEPTTIGGPGLRDSHGREHPAEAAIWHTRTGKVIACPYEVGQRLWVRESIWCANDTDGEMGEVYDCGSMLSLGERYAQVQYAATPDCCDLPVPACEQTIDPDHANHEHRHGWWWLGPPDDWDGSDEDRERRGVWSFLPTTFWTKHPSIHMPRWASRITLEVTGVRVERLQAITEKDAKAEGVERDTEPCDHTRMSCEEIGCMGPTYRSTFAELWTQINGRESWDSNPWVWVVEFKRIEAQERAA